MAQGAAGGVLKGYPKLAKLMGPYPDYAIFRKFGSLSVLNLLKLQAELISLEEKIRNQQLIDDASTDGDVSIYSVNFEKLNNSKHPADDQLKLIEESRIKLEQYNSLLLQAARVAQLPSPEDAHLKFLRKWLIGQHPAEGNNFQKANPNELLRTWDRDLDKDLIALGARNSDAGDLGHWFKPFVVNIHHWIWERYHPPVDEELATVWDHDQSRFLKYGKSLVILALVVIASLIPALVILWLSHVNKTSTRIWITIGFTGGLGLFMKGFTNANMKEIFAAAAAFAAVEVVFIGTADGK